MKKTVLSGGKGATISGLLLVFALIMYPRPQTVTGNVILGIGIILAVLALLRGLRHPRAALLPWAFTVLAAVSSLWSDDPKISFTLALALVVPLFIAGLISNNLDFTRFLRISDRTLKTLVIVSIVLGYAVPAIGITQRVVNHGTLRGIYEHRNGMGFIIAIALVTHLAVNWGAKKNLLSRWVWNGIFVFALIRAGSSGALLIVIVSLLLYGLIRQLSRELPRNRGPLFAAFLCVVLAVSPFVVIYAPNVLAFFNRDTSFTGRTDIWRGAVTAWEHKFWFGYGWANILGENTEAAQTISAFAGYTVRSAHSGYLATALQLGLVGLVLSVLVLLVVLVRTIRLALQDPSPKAVWCFLMLLILIIGDFAETRTFVNVGWFFIGIIAYSSRPEPKPKVRSFLPKNAGYEIVGVKPILVRPMAR